MVYLAGIGVSTVYYNRAAIKACLAPYAFDYVKHGKNVEERRTVFKHHGLPGQNGAGDDRQYLIFSRADIELAAHFPPAVYKQVHFHLD
jgi:hypothetical protein